MLIDTHCHVNLNAFREDGPQAIQRALDAGVAVVNVGTQVDTSRQAVKFLENFQENVYAVVGLHPVHTFKHLFHDEEELSFKTRDEVFDYKAYKELANNPRVVGIGECGLDYFRLPEHLDHEEVKGKQRSAFLEQIKLAQELDKALCIHCRPSPGTMDAYEEIIEIINPYCHSEIPSRHSERSEESSVSAALDPSPSAQDDKPLRFEIHCYTGDLPTAQKFVEIGAYIGLNGIITFDKTGRSEEIVKNIPLESIILETDAPYLTPVPYRGKRNEPAYIVEVAKKIAKWKNVSLEKVAEATTINAKKLFKL